MNCSADVGSFSDEAPLKFENVRGKMFFASSTCPPTNDNLMELLIMADALHRASSQRITALFPIMVMLAGQAAEISGSQLVLKWWQTLSVRLE